MKTRSKRARGVAMLFAIWLLSFVVLALAALALAIAHQSRRTLVNSQEDQLRQLLLAGERLVSEDPASIPASRPINVALPRELAEAGYTLRLTGLPESADSGSIRVEIDAALPHDHRSQLLIFTPSGTLVDAQLD